MGFFYSAAKLRGKAKLPMRGSKKLPLRGKRARQTKLLRQFQIGVVYSFPNIDRLFVPDEYCLDMEKEKSNATTHRVH